MRRKIVLVLALEHRGLAAHIFETQREALDSARPWTG